MRVAVWSVRRLRAARWGYAVKIYLGQTRAKALIKRFNDFGFGEITQPRELPPRRTPWAFDNGAYSQWKKGEPFDAEKYRAALDKAAAVPTRPDFVVVPDLVAAGLQSLSLSLEWVEECRRVGPPYLVVQNGMTEDDVSKVIDRFDGLFVGGDDDWKRATSAAWVVFAHAHGKPCHIGRTGTRRKAAWAKRIDVDSIDSCFPLWSTQNLEKFLCAVVEDHPGFQPELF